MRGFAAIVAQRFKSVNDNEEFKEFSKDISVKLLLNPTDQKFAALISVEKGTLTVEGIRNDDKKALKKKTLGWNGRMATNLQTFMKLAAGQVGLGKLLLKILTRKVKVRGLIYFILQEKLSSFVAEQSESDVQKPLIIANKNKSLIASRLFLISGFFHIIIWNFTEKI